MNTLREPAGSPAMGQNFGRADIGNNATGRQHIGDLGEYGLERAYRRCEDNDIGAGDA